MRQRARLKNEFLGFRELIRVHHCGVSEIWEEKVGVGGRVCESYVTDCRKEEFHVRCVDLRLAVEESIPSLQGELWKNP